MNKTSNARTLGFAWAPLTAVLVGLALYGSPVSIDLSVSRVKDFGSLLLTLGFFGALLGWGRVISGEKVISSMGLALGSVALSTSTTLLGMLIVPRFGFSWALAIGVTLPLVMFGQMSFRLSGIKTGVNSETRLAFLLLGVLITTRLIDGSVLHNHGDSYICYLTAPRIWVESGGLAAFREDPALFLSSSWESLFLWGNLLLGGYGGKGLDAAQRFAQWITLLAGYLGAIWVLFDLSKMSPNRATHRSGSVLVAFVISILALGGPALGWLPNLAKGDMGCIFWALAGFSMVLRGRSFWGGLLLGAAAIGKLPYGVFVVVAVISATVFAPKKSRARFFFWVTLGGVLGASPILLRNVILTGNPFFPFLNGIFRSSVMGPSYEAGAGIATAHGAFSFSRQLEFLIEVFKHQPWNAMVLLHFIPKKRFVKWGIAPFGNLERSIAFCAFASVLLFNLVFRAQTEIRYQGPALVLTSFAALWMGYAILSRLLEGVFKRVPRPALWTLALTVGLTQVPVFRWIQMGKGKIALGAVQVRGLANGEAKLWVSQNLASSSKFGEKVAVLGDNQLYYVSHKGAYEVTHNPSADREFQKSNTTDERIVALKRLGYRWVFYANDPALAHQNRFYDEFRDRMKASPKCIRFTGPYQIISDLNCL